MVGYMLIIIIIIYFYLLLLFLNWPRWGQDELACRMLVIIIVPARRHTCRIDCSTWNTKVIGITRRDKIETREYLSSVTPVRQLCRETRPHVITHSLRSFRA